MITITKGDSVPGLPDLMVSSASGDYADTDLILCARKDAPGFDTAMFQAQFIRYGEVVYQHETPEALGAALVAIDAASTHDAAQLWREEEARRLARERGTLAPGDPVPAPDALESAPVPEQDEDDVKFFKEQAEEETASTTPQTPETPETPQDREIPVIDIEPPAGEVEGAASSTPAEPMPPPIPDIAFEAPPIDAPPETPSPANVSTTTPL